VQLNPVADQSKGTSRQGTMEHLCRTDGYLSLELTESSMEMGRWMVVEVHCDHDPVKG